MERLLTQNETFSVALALTVAIAQLRTFADALSCAQKGSSGVENVGNSQIAAVAAAFAALTSCARHVRLGDLVDAGSAISLHLAELSDRGDRLAQLASGDRVERGLDAGVEPSQACAIYMWRPQSLGGDQWIYNPMTRGVERYRSSRSSSSPDQMDELALRAYCCRAAPAGQSK